MRVAVLTAAVLSLAACSAPAPQSTDGPGAQPAGSAADKDRIKGVLEDAGLVGTWGVNCEGPLDSAEWERIEIEADGAARTHLGGGQYRTDYLIVDAVRTAPGEVKATVEADDQKLVIVYRLEPDRQMTWSSYVEGGQALITDGVSISGRQSAWYNRCPNGLPAA
jgi:hypothetical protein